MSNEAAATGIAEKTGVSVTADHLAALRAGEISAPAVEVLRAVAVFFGVDTRYLIEPWRSEDIDSQLDALRAMRDARIRAVICARAGQPSPAAVLALARTVARATADRHCRNVGADEWGAATR